MWVSSMKSPAPEDVRREDGKSCFLNSSSSFSRDRELRDVVWFAMSKDEVDSYLANTPPNHRRVLEQLRETMLLVVPQAEQGISYRVPAFFVGEGVVGGFASFKDHMSYLPFSGSVLSQLSVELAGFSYSKGALRFTVERPLSEGLIDRLISIRLAEMAGGKR